MVSRPRQDMLCSNGRERVNTVPERHAYLQKQVDQQLQHSGTAAGKLVGEKIVVCVFANRQQVQASGIYFSHEIDRSA